MTDALTKYTELQQLTNIEYERQRHLANWLMQSSIHMPDPLTQHNNSNSNNSKKKNSKKISKQQQQQQSASPIIFLNKISNNVSVSKATINSLNQTNLPLQIVARDGHKPKLRRFNSHDTSANMFSVADFENARLARRNELENASLMKQRNRYKMNSLSSGGDYSTGDSKGSKFSTESISDPLPVELFLDKFALPRIVRLSYDENISTLNTMTSFSSNESNNNNTSMEVEKMKPKNGDLLLLYRHLKDHKVYHLMNAKQSSRKRGIRIPQDFQGYFSLVNERGSSTASCYTTIVQLVRERVYKFLSVDTLTAYSESQTSDKPHSKSHYIKGTAKAGQVFRLLAVFQDGSQQEPSKASSQNGTTLNGREKERGRYAQLVGENRQIIYVSLSSKGKFYEIDHQTPQMLQVLKNNRQLTKPVNPDCVHRIANIITADTELPINLKYISGPVGHNMIPETVTVHRVSRENVLIACPIEETTDERNVLQLRKIAVTPNMKLVKCFLGFENEQKMFSNQNVQNMFKFCQFNADDFARNIDVEPLPQQLVHSGSNRIKGDGLKLLNPLTKLLNKTDRSSNSGHEKEDSIIFLSKNDLESLTVSTNPQPLNESSDKMKVFQPSTKKSWFKNLRSKNNSIAQLDVQPAKCDSIDRYKDMSKLIQERFGNIEDDVTRANETTPPRPSSEIGFKNGVSDTLQKSFSLQDLDSKNRPDILNVSATQESSSTSSMINSEKHQKKTNKTFFSDKLYSEFHVKTKQHSKSSSSLHQLLQFGKATSSTAKPENSTHQVKRDEERYPFEIKFQRDFPVMFEPYDRQDDCSLTILDDLPYSSVRDSIVMQEEEERENLNRAREGSASPKPPSENIYAELFTQEPRTNEREITYDGTSSSSGCYRKDSNSLGSTKSSDDNKQGNLAVSI
uniref:CSON013306 protein n=1 Tax=Culicoides sonorensis TaxID=179676 RepID=A0A336M7L0_CULSO